MEEMIRQLTNNWTTLVLWKQHKCTKSPRTQPNNTATNNHQLITRRGTRSSGRHQRLISHTWPDSRHQENLPKPQILTIVFTIRIIQIISKHRTNLSSRYSHLMLLRIRGMEIRIHSILSRRISWGILARSRIRIRLFKHQVDSSSSLSTLAA